MRDRLRQCKLQEPGFEVTLISSGEGAPGFEVTLISTGEGAQAQPLSGWSRWSPAGSRRGRPSGAHGGPGRRNRVGWHLSSAGSSIGRSRNRPRATTFVSGEIPRFPRTRSTPSPPSSSPTDPPLSSGCRKTGSTAARSSYNSASRSTTRCGRCSKTGRRRPTPHRSRGAFCRPKIARPGPATPHLTKRFEPRPIAFEHAQTAFDDVLIDHGRTSLLESCGANPAGRCAGPTPGRRTLSSS